MLQNTDCSLVAFIFEAKLEKNTFNLISWQLIPSPPRTPKAFQRMGGVRPIPIPGPRSTPGLQDRGHLRTQRGGRGSHGLSARESSGATVGDVEAGVGVEERARSPG